MAVLTLENLIVPPTSQILAPGMPAPDFALPCGPDETCRLRDLRGSNVILAFYPADWSPVCGDQTSLYNEVLEEFEALDAKVLGISVDSLWCHQAYAQQRKLRFPLLADFEPKGEVARRYGVYDAANGTSERALFVIDKDGVIRWSYLSPPEINPGADGILAALESIAAAPHLSHEAGADPGRPRRGCERRMRLPEHQPKLAIPVSEKDHAQGPADAPVTLVEYGDYECPYCGKAYPAVRRIQRMMGERLRFVFRNFPLNTLHEHASEAAQAAEAAAAQGKFWEMHDLLYENQDNLEDVDLRQYALKAGLEIYRFEADMAGETYAKKVREDFRGGVRSGVNGTPTFFINGYRFNEIVNYENLLTAVKAAAEGKWPAEAAELNANAREAKG